MWLLAWSVQTHDGLEDIWTVHETEEEARQRLAKIIDRSDLYCWVIAPSKDASEPHWRDVS